MYQRQRRVLQGKKDALSLPGHRYHHLCWRLDVEVGSKITLCINYFFIDLKSCINLPSVCVQLARRDMHALAVPKFQLRLDLQEQGIASTASGEEDIDGSGGDDAGRDPQQQQQHRVSVSSVHLQSDLAALKRVQRELQAAVDETAGVHYQRISRYLT
jgi:hypothetical protein